MTTQVCMYCKRPVYDGTGYHPECVPKPGQATANVRVSAVRAAAPARTAESVLSAGKPAAVRIVDVSMPFGSMVVFMLKWAIASIPATIILAVIFIVVAAVIGLMFGGGLPRLP